MKHIEAENKKVLISNGWRKPNFFIVGAPKCGTTALASYLGEHNQVCMSQPKEPHYFNTDVWYQRITSEKDYARCFDKANTSHIAVGEASVFYLHSNVAISRIIDFNPDAKFIVMIRNPVDLVYSYHEQLVFNGDENIRDFHSAWLAQIDREEGARLPFHFNGNPMIFQYKQIGLLSERLKRLFDVAGKEKVHLIVMDDMKSDMLNVYRYTLEFLGVPYDGRTDFPRVNESKVTASKAILHGTRLLGRIRRQLGLPRIGSSLMEKVYKINTSPRERVPLPNRFRAELAEVYGDEITELSKLIGRDLDHWKK